MRIVRMVKIKFDCSIKRVDDTQHNGTTYTFYSLQMNDQAIFRWFLIVCSVANQDGAEFSILGIRFFSQRCLQPNMGPL